MSILGIRKMIIQARIIHISQNLFRVINHAQLIIMEERVAF